MDSRELQTASILVILLALYVIAGRLGITRIFNLFPAIGTSLSLGMLFVIGLLTSVHCIAMCGGINLTQSTLAARNHSRIARANLAYNAGRVLSYTAVGGLAGGLGGVIAFSGAMRGAVTVAAGCAMILMALNMLGVLKPLRRLNLRLPSFLYEGLSGALKKRSSFAIGLLNGLMPCGPLQSMQIYALSLGSAWRGMAAMLLFSLGTVPLMFGFGFAAGKLNRRFMRTMLTVSAMLIFLMGLHMAGNGLSLSGVSISGGRGRLRTAVEMDGRQVVRTEVDYGSYEAISVRAGLPVEWTIVVPEGRLNGCNSEILIPAYDLDIRLHEGENTVTFTPKETGSFPYSCWMGMIKSRIEVVPAA